MIGRRFDKAKRVVVMVIDEDDRQHGFEVYPPNGVEWSWAGIVTSSPIGSGSAATMTVTGRFHRIDRPPEDVSIATPQPKELNP